MKHQRFSQTNEFEPREPAFPPSMSEYVIEVTHHDEKGQAKRVRRLPVDRLLAPFR
jgi:hypothetical protein